VYLAKTEMFSIFNQTVIAESVGITKTTLCRIINRKQATNKTTAYCIVKVIHPEAKIEEYFEKIK
jgi:DNA-binding XRE family transcriptional regulator